VSASQRGINRERKLRVLLELEGWWTIRAAGSLGDVDVVAMRAGDAPLFIEVKSTSGGPYERFGPVKRDALAAAATRAGAVAWLVWWPPYRDPRWIAESEWPVMAVAA
jgi:Holliday junction resolvase